MSQKSSAQELFQNMEIQFQNIHNLLIAFQESTITSNKTINVELYNYDGSTYTVQVNSFQNIQQEIARVDQNFNSLTNSDNISYIVNADGSISQYSKTSFLNAEFLTNFKFDGDNCIIDNNTIIEDLCYPSIKLPITIDSKIKTDVKCRIYEITEGWEQILDDPTILQIEYLYKQGKILYKEYNRTLPLSKIQIKNFGKFTTLSVNVDSTVGVVNTFNIILKEIKYTAIDIIGNSIDLKVGDILVTKTGASKYLINSIDKFTKALNVTRIAGIEILTVGIDTLYFNEIIDSDKENVINIPIKPNKKLIIFLSTENLVAISFPSIGIKIDTSTYKVNFENNIYTLDEYFSKYVINFSEYLLGLMNETSIPYSLGIKPKQPILDVQNFKVVQTNKHLLSSQVVNDFDNMVKQKQSIENDINNSQNEIDKLQSDLNSNKYNSIEEQTYRVNRIIDLRYEINTLNQNKLEIERNIDKSAIESGIKFNKPIYNVIGFWAIQDSIYSPSTKAQQIIKYDVQFRYLSINSDTIDNTSYKLVLDGKTTTVALSAWQDLQTTTLDKYLDPETNKMLWKHTVLENIDEININQLSVLLHEQESIEIRVRAVSEAGYPISPLKSDWSDIIRINFPSSLKTNNINTLVNQNQIDLIKSEFNYILQKTGLLSHINGTIIEGEKTFNHRANDIASGFFTNEQKNIPLDVFLQKMQNQIDILQSINVVSEIKVALIDFNEQTLNVSNQMVIRLFAGNYNDNLELLDETKWGTIIRKTAYIKIINSNTTPIEIKTLVPGVYIDATNAPKYYNVPVHYQDKLTQASKQIIYSRNVDVTGQQEKIYTLVNPKLPDTLTIPDINDIDINAQDSDKNIVYYDETKDEINICKLLNDHSTEFIALTTEHPNYEYNNLEKIKPEFERLKKYTQNIKAPKYQSESNENDIYGVGFNDNDFWNIGTNSCGSFLYPFFANENVISVNGNTTQSTLVINANSEILIPIIFEYRMIDRLGNIDGMLYGDFNTPLEYTKTIGIDLLINNNLFSFDIEVYAKLKSKVIIPNTLSLSSLQSKYIPTEKKENLY